METHRLAKWSGPVHECLRWYWDAPGSELLSAHHDGGALHQVVGHLGDRAVLGLGEERARRPRVERAHGRSAPELVVDAALGLADDGPSAREAEVGAERQRHLVACVRLGSRQLLGITLPPEVAR